MNPIRLRVTWPLVALVVSVEVFVGVLFYALTEAKMIDREFLKYVVGFLLGSGVTAPIPLVSWFREKKIAFDITSDPPKGEP